MRYHHGQVFIGYPPDLLPPPVLLAPLAYLAPLAPYLPCSAGPENVFQCAKSSLFIIFKVTLT